MPDSDNLTVNANLDHTYTSLAPLSERQQEALETGLNPQLFVFAEEEPPPPEEDQISPNQVVFTAEGEQRAPLEEKVVKVKRSRLAKLTGKKA